MQKQSFLTKLVIKLGLAKNEKQAPMVLLAVVVLAVVVMFVLWPRNGASDRVSPAAFDAHAAVTLG